MKVDELLKNWGPKQRKGIASWIRERVIEMEPDRESIQDEYGFDLVAKLDDIRRSLDST